MYFIIHKPKDQHRFTSFCNEIFNTEKAALDYGERNKFKKNIQWKAVEYNEENINKYWYKQKGKNEILKNKNKRYKKIYWLL